MEDEVFWKLSFRDPNMEFELRVATLKGNVPSLLELLTKDKLLLKNFTIENHRETPLHIAAMLGHLEFVVEVLTQEAELAKKQDSQGSTPLHLATAKGYFNIVVSLLTINLDLCSICDREKRNPLHIAAMKGHVDVLEFLIRAKPDVARDKVKNGQTILHLCVKHDRPEALKLLIDVLNDDQFINTKDDDGNTILHLAAEGGQIETIRFLISKGVNQNIKNSRGFTALRPLAQGESSERLSEIMDSTSENLNNHNPSRQIVYVNNMVPASHPLLVGEENRREWQGHMHDMLMVVATLIAAIAFQASTTQNDKFNDRLSDHRFFLIFNTISFIASLSVIMLLISGLPLKRLRISTWIVMLTMWIAITSTAMTYSIVLRVFSPEQDIWNAANAGGKAVGVWARLMALIFLCQVIRLILKLVRKGRKFINNAEETEAGGRCSLVPMYRSMLGLCQKKCTEPQGHARVDAT